MKPDFSHHDADWAPRSPLEADARTEALRRPSRDSDPRPRGGRDRAEPIVVRLVRRFEWNADSVFAAWVDPVIAGQWVFATAARPMVSAAIDARAGGSFCLCEQRAEEIVEHSGTYVEFMAIDKKQDGFLQWARAVEKEIEPELKKDEARVVDTMK